MDHQEEYNKKLENTVNQAEKADQENDLIRLSTGVVLKRVAFARTILVDILRNFKEPEIPKFYNESKDRWEDNPLDPDYANAVEAYKLEIGFALLDVAICLGTVFKELPKNVPNPYDPGWSATFSGLGINIPEDPRLRYLKWVKYVAAPTEEDITAIADSVMPDLGVRETTVEAALNSFPGDEERKSDSEN